MPLIMKADKVLNLLQIFRKTLHACAKAGFVILSCPIRDTIITMKISIKYPTRI